MQNSTKVQTGTTLQDPDYPNSFTGIFKLYYKPLLCFAGGMLCTREAEDVVQEAFIKLWERRQNFNSLAAVKAFLYLSVKNNCLNHIKHCQVVNRFERSTVITHDENAALKRLMETETHREIQAALHSLPPGCRNIIHHGYFEGLSNREVADKLYVSINTVKTQKVRALQLLRSVFKTPAHYRLSPVSV